MKPLIKLASVVAGGLLIVWTYNTMQAEIVRGKQGAYVFLATVVVIILIYWRKPGRGLLTTLAVLYWVILWLALPIALTAIMTGRLAQLTQPGKFFFCLEYLVGLALGYWLVFLTYKVGNGILHTWPSHLMEWFKDSPAQQRPKP